MITCNNPLPTSLFDMWEELPPTWLHFPEFKGAQSSYQGPISKGIHQTNKFIAMRYFLGREPHLDFITQNPRGIWEAAEGSTLLWPKKAIRKIDKDLLSTLMEKGEAHIHPQGKIRMYMPHTIILHPDAPSLGVLWDSEESYPEEEEPSGPVELSDLGLRERLDREVVTIHRDKNLILIAPELDDDLWVEGAPTACEILNIETGELRYIHRDIIK